MAIRFRYGRIGSPKTFHTRSVGSTNPYRVRPAPPHRFDWNVLECPEDVFGDCINVDVTHYLQDRLDDPPGEFLIAFGELGQDRERLVPVDVIDQVTGPGRSIRTSVGHPLGNARRGRS